MNGGYICCVGDQDKHGNPVDLANAQLIAAAPDLLEELTNAAKYFEREADSYMFPPGERAGFRARAKCARAALAKAESGAL